jgi:signal transduction histidine kinase
MERTRGLSGTRLVAAERIETGPAAVGLIETRLVAGNLDGAGLTATGRTGGERKRVEAVVETLATLRSEGESLAEVAHDARNMVTALGLYCDLLDEDGVLGAPYAHYAGELRLVAAASRRLVEKLVALDTRQANGAGLAGIAGAAGTANASGTLAGDAVWAGAGFPAEIRQARRRRWDPLPAVPIDNLAGELLANRNLLAALAGPSIALTVDIQGGSQAVRLTGEDLTRILVNLVKNAAEAMPEGGRIQLGLGERSATMEAAPWLVLTVEDNGPGIPHGALDEIFTSGYTTRAERTPGPAPSADGVSSQTACPEGPSERSSSQNGWPTGHRGLGLSITRSIIEAAGGAIHAANRARGGARFEILLPACSR